MRVDGDGGCGIEWYFFVVVRSGRLGRWSLGKSEELPLVWARALTTRQFCGKLRACCAKSASHVLASLRLVFLFDAQDGNLEEIRPARPSARGLTMPTTPRNKAWSCCSAAGDTRLIKFHTCSRALNRYCFQSWNRPRLTSCSCRLNKGASPQDGIQHLCRSTTTSCLLSC